ncbi:calcium-activated chloride channel regulator 1-like [Haemaphysalis longicornis]
MTPETFRNCFRPAELMTEPGSRSRTSISSRPVTSLFSPLRWSAIERMLLVASSLLCFLSVASCLQIDTEDGGYKDIKVSISKDVPYNESIVENIRVLFQSSSEFLHRATNGRVYFKHVIIELPDTWPKRDGARALSQSLFDKSDVRIEMPTKARGDMPFTQQPKPCGQPGDFIQLTPGFLALTQNATARKVLNPAYVFVHEWAHFRYGVFDEYGSLGDKKYPLTYCHKGMVRLNACSERIVFVARTPTGGRCKIDTKCQFDKDCVVTSRQPGEEPVESSVMFMPYIANVSQFCDQNNGVRRHNPLAPNKQNALCQQRSTWEVISGNADFKSLPRPDTSKRIEVTFQEEQQKEDLAQRVVLVLDVSGSMDDYDRLKFLKDAATRYINDIKDGTQRLAIVTFSNFANVAHPLMPVNANTREGFLKKVRGLKAYGPTCIGCGLQRALRLLNTTSERPEGAIIVLMSDGEENQVPDILTMKPKVEEAKVTVNTLALGATADHKLEELAIATKAKAYAFKDLEGNLGLELETAFVEATTAQVDHIQRAQTLVDTVEVFQKKFEREFQIDGGVGNETVVVVKRNSPERFHLKAWLVDPYGNVCQACKETRDTTGTLISIPNPAKVGTWRLHLETNSTEDVDVSVQVKSQARKDGGEPIRVTCEVGNILVGKPNEAVVYAKVTKGKQVVLNAVVQAEVSGPKVDGQTHKSTFFLHDDGRAPDNHADDGTYSGYFTKFVGKGRYAVSAHVSNQNGTRLADPLGGSGSFFSTAMFTLTSTVESVDAASEYPLDDFIVVNITSEGASVTSSGLWQPVDDFQRVASGGSFQVTADIVEKQVPPGDIRDLSVADVQQGSNGTLLVQLTWTWPGAHLTAGKASAVELRASDDYTNLRSSFDNQTEITNAKVVVGNLDPLPSGARHVVTVALPAIFATPRSDGESNWSVYIAARVRNSDGLSSDTSNIAVASYTPPPVTTTVAITTTTPATTTTEVSTTQETTTEEVMAAQGVSQPSKVVLSSWAWILIGVAAAFVVIIIVVAVVIRMDPNRRGIYRIFVTRSRKRQTTTP